ncbi:hypothetical protein ACSBR1_007348 [Camellia fascicularis]
MDGPKSDSHSCGFSAMECVFGSTFVCKTIDAARERMPYIWGDDAEDFRPERWLNNGVFQPESPFKFITFHKRLYMLIFISGKNKNENMEMECMIEFPHTHMDRRPRKRPRLGWDIAPQALKEGATKEDIE